ncbi:sugar ABC transporter [Cyanobium sp. CH-040]|uniref:sugar ABC transporter n=1 Tax=Cyanobium sp. CH-040 TaxID=2823708 RepID=UPI0020CCC5C3|nr:sugar ABC transporter [Cyanobium sp. CH-040]MCP9927999.1 sugar ABC transporter [Cyanobium sp. CH-040]
MIQQTRGIRIRDGRARAGGRSLRDELRAVGDLAAHIANRALARARGWSTSLISGAQLPGLPGSGDLVPGFDAPAASPDEPRRRLRDRLKAPLEPILRIPLPVLLAGLVLGASAIYFFSIGRNRYQVDSSFIVRLPQAPAGTTGTLLGTTLAGPTMLGSLEDGRFLAVYLTSPEVMRRVFLQLKPEDSWGRKPGDPFAGLPEGASVDQQLAFFRRQVMVVPQDLSGVINLTTVGLQPEASFKLNQLLLREAEDFLNRSNSTISLNQQQFFEQEVERARQRLDKANEALNSFKNQYGEVNLSQAASASSSFISELESKLVDLRVQEASLKRQFRDPTTPEVAFVTDQVRELERQIREERELLVNPEGRDLNRLLAESSKLETEVLLATEALKGAINSADSSRQRVQQQLKFLVRLADPQQPTEQSYDWRWKGFLGVIGGLVLLWGIGSFSLGIISRR